MIWVKSQVGESRIGRDRDTNDTAVFYDCFQRPM